MKMIVTSETHVYNIVDVDDYVIIQADYPLLSEKCTPDICAPILFSRQYWEEQRKLHAADLKGWLLSKYPYVCFQESTYEKLLAGQLKGEFSLQDIRLVDNISEIREVFQKEPERIVVNKLNFNSQCYDLQGEVIPQKIKITVYDSDYDLEAIMEYMQSKSIFTEIELGKNTNWRAHNAQKQLSAIIVLPREDYIAEYKKYYYENNPFPFTYKLHIFDEFRLKG